MAITKATEKDLVHIGGDVPDPSGQFGRARGVQTTYDLERTKFGEPKVKYQDRAGNEYLLTVDVYKYEGAPMEVLLFCPMCSRPGAMHTLRISQERKHIEFDPDYNPMVPWGKSGKNVELGGRLSVQTFSCSHELDASKGVGFVSSANLCRWRVIIDNNIARDM